MNILEIIEKNWLYLLTLTLFAIASGRTILKKVKILKKKNERIIYHFSIWKNEDNEESDSSNSVVGIIPAFLQKIYFVFNLLIFLWLIIIYFSNIWVDQNQIPDWLVYSIATIGFLTGVTLRYISNTILWAYYQKKYCPGFDLGNHDYVYGKEILIPK